MNKITKTSLTLSFLILASLVSATGAFANYGSAPDTSGQNGPASAPVCNNTVPGVPSFNFVRRVANNQIEIGWNATANATSWTVAYGNQPGKYIYGVSNFGNADSRSLKIGMLPTGVYYVVVKANNGCMPGSFSPERKMTVFASGNVLGAKTRTGTILGAKTTPGVTPSAGSPTGGVELSGTGTPTPTSGQGGNIFQRFFHFLFGR